MFRGPKLRSPGLSMTGHPSNLLAPVPTLIPRVPRLSQGKALVPIRAANAFAVPLPVAASAATVEGQVVEPVGHLAEAAIACRIATGVEHATRPAKPHRVASPIHRRLTPKHLCYPERVIQTSPRVSPTSKRLPWGLMAVPFLTNNGHPMTETSLPRASVPLGPLNPRRNSACPVSGPATCRTYTQRRAPKWIAFGVILRGS